MYITVEIQQFVYFPGISLRELYQRRLSPNFLGEGFLREFVQMQSVSIQPAVAWVVCFFSPKYNSFTYDTR